ncbi:hypothetical protein LCGC14_1922120 [marine sediment metagenome]|uniref:HNH nuclease domain-containing protein n=1 Tax=marine sediment metagenome TaxID=412755 RepID=A0A0F9IN68_9ZZZZ
MPAVVAWPRSETGQFLSQGGRQPISCAVCGIGFELYASDIKRGRRFCSRPCAYRAGTPHPTRRKRVEKICEICTIHFEVCPSIAEGRRFCSNKCKGTSMTIRPQIQAFYASAVWQDIRQQVLARDGHRCTMCQSQPERLIAHHLDEMKNNPPETWTNIDRIVSACQPCHNDAHGFFFLEAV